MHYLHYKVKDKLKGGHKVGLEGLKGQGRAGLRIGIIDGVKKYFEPF